MSNNHIKLVNEGGKIVGKDSETEDIIPLELGDTIADSLTTQSVATEDLESIRPQIRADRSAFDSLRSHRDNLRSRVGRYRKPTFMWTFDDAHQTVYDYRDELDALDITFGIAVNPANVGTGSWMSWEQIKDLCENYDVEIINHGKNHDAFSDLTDAEIEAEVNDAAEELAARGLQHRHYAYAHGDHGSDVGKGIVSELYPYGWGITYRESDTLGTDGPYNMPRFKADRVGDSSELEGYIDQSISDTTGGVFYGHKIVDSNPGSLETTIGAIQDIVAYVRNQGYEWADSLDEIVRHSRDVWAITDDTDAGVKRRNNGGTDLLELIAPTEGNILLRGGEVQMRNGGPAPEPTDLSNVSGNRDGEWRMHDGTGTLAKGPFWWDDSANQWVSFEDSAVTL